MSDVTEKETPPVGTKGSFRSRRRFKPKPEYKASFRTEDRFAGDKGYEVYGGNENYHLPNTTVKFAHTQGRYGNLVNESLPLAEFFDGLYFSKTRGGGDEFVVGPVFAGDSRDYHPAVKEAHFIVLESVSGASVETLCQRFNEVGCLAYLWTTQDSGREETPVEVDAVTRYLKELRRNRYTSPEDACFEYLAKEEKLHPDALATARYLEKRPIPPHAGGVAHHMIAHAPLTQCRVVVPLAKPFGLWVANSSVEVRVAEWKGVCEDLAARLGISHRTTFRPAYTLRPMPRLWDASDDYRRVLVPGELLDVSL